MTRPTIILVAVAALFAVVRFLVPVTPLDLSITSLYKDAAHLFLGGIIGAAILGRRWDYGVVAAVLTGVELVAFFARN